jgi:hypothetical protein
VVLQVHLFHHCARLYCGVRARGAKPFTQIVPGDQSRREGRRSKICQGTLPCGYVQHWSTGPKAAQIGARTTRASRCPSSSA